MNITAKWYVKHITYVWVNYDRHFSNNIIYLVLPMTGIGALRTDCLAAKRARKQMRPD